MHLGLHRFSQAAILSHYISALVPETDGGLLIFFTANTTTTDARAATAANVAVIGNSGVLVGVGEDELELEATLTVPLMSL